MARFEGLGLDPILADSDDDDGDMGFRRSGFGVRGGDDRRGRGGGNDAVRLGSFDRHDHRQHSRAPCYPLSCNSCVILGLSGGLGLLAS